MYRIVNKFPYLELRLFIAVLISVFLIVTDSKYDVFLSFKNYIENPIYLFYHLYEKPNYMLHSILQALTGYKKLISENDLLRKELFIKNSELLLLDQYKQENCTLHALLNAPIPKNNRKLITKILLNKVDPYNQQIIINQGINKSVYIGQPVISDIGVVGQVISVNKFNSRILLISDPNHALSVKIKRNNICMILMGCGNVAELYAECPMNYINIYVNDILVTSGLDGRFPEGYPVAKVFNVQFNPEKDCMVIRAKPVVDLQHLKYVILVWE